MFLCEYYHRKLCLGGDGYCINSHPASIYRYYLLNTENRCKDTLRRVLFLCARKAGF
jgi:hypothetical protein